MNRKSIILDRDGVVNYDSDAYIKSLSEWDPLPGSIEAIANLYKHGYRVFVATNQSGLGRKYYDHKELNRMHMRLASLLAEMGAKIDALVYCPHTPDDKCDCRKPCVGLFLRLKDIADIELQDVITVGDSYRDLIAGQKVGCRPVLVRTGKGLLTEQEYGPELNNIPIFDDLAAATDAIISNQL